MIKIIFLTILTWSGPDAPADSLRLETINGKTFIIHLVGDHETLYALSKRYGASIPSIKEFNPSVDAGLELGQILKIPYTPRSSVVTKEGTVHKVAAKETLYSIARLYNVSPEDIKSWNNLRDGNLSIGQDIIIKKKISTTAATTTNTPATTVTGNSVPVSSDKHTVEPKETLYAIARKYGVSVQQLKDWNSLQSSDVKTGDILIVKNPGSKTAEVKTPGSRPVVVAESKPVVTDPKPVSVETVKTPTETKPAVIDTKPVATDVSNANVKETPIMISEGTRGSDEVKEGGLAELIEGTEGNRKYLALHKTAKTGTIMKVRNELNNREVFVRVIGPIPATDVNNRIVIKISKSAYDRLGAIDPKFRAEVTYYK